MDRNLRTPYNLRSSGHSTAQNTTAMTSFASSTSASSDRLTAATSASVMACQSQSFSSLVPGKPATIDPSSSGNETSIFWTQSQAQTMNPQNFHAMQPTVNQHHAPSSAPVPRAELAGPSATAPFLRDFTLVAEAAKRAQMAVVMRDLEGITL